MGKKVYNNSLLAAFPSCMLATVLAAASMCELKVIDQSSASFVRSCTQVSQVRLGTQQLFDWTDKRARKEARRNQQINAVTPSITSIWHRYLFIWFKPELSWYFITRLLLELEIPLYQIHTNVYITFLSQPQEPRIFLALGLLLF